jgi:hypothetical protein
MDHSYNQIPFFNNELKDSISVRYPKLRLPSSYLVKFILAYSASLNVVVSKSIGNIQIMVN